MKKVIRMIAKVVHISSLCGVMIVGVLGVIYDIVGHAKFEQILSDFGISKGFESMWIVGAIMLLLLIVTHYIKEKLVN